MGAVVELMVTALEVVTSTGASAALATAGIWASDTGVASPVFDLP